jgi:hypothetical protein
LSTICVAEGIMVPLAEWVAVEALEPPELPEVELPILAPSLLITTVAEVGVPKSAPLIETSVMANCLPLPAAVTGTEITLGDVSSLPHVSEPLV